MLIKILAFHMIRIKTSITGITKLDFFQYAVHIHFTPSSFPYNTPSTYSTDSMVLHNTHRQFCHDFHKRINLRIGIRWC